MPNPSVISDGMTAQQRLLLAREGARNLLVNCAGIQPGDKLLIIGEDGDEAYYDKSVCDLIAEAALGLGAQAEVLIAPDTNGPEDFPDSVSNAMQRASSTIFVARLGDQLRFCSLPGQGRKAMCCLPDIDYLADPFARNHYDILRRVNAAMESAIERAGTYRITCPRGTDVTASLGPVSDAAATDNRMTPFSVDLFPVMIFAPLTCTGMSGRLAMSHWLTTSSTRKYPDPVLKLDTTVTAHIERGRITRFEGDAAEVGRTRDHFERIGRLVGGDPMAVNSWHTGINPRTFYKERPEDNVERWGDMVYGSPRFTHFHACGSDPGDISIMLLDATISFDGEEYWKDGRFVFLDRPEIAGILSEFQTDRQAFDMRWDIGI